MLGYGGCKTVGDGIVRPAFMGLYDYAIIYLYEITSLKESNFKYSHELFYFRITS